MLLEVTPKGLCYLVDWCVSKLSLSDFRQAALLITISPKDPTTNRLGQQTAQLNVNRLGTFKVLPLKLAALRRIAKPRLRVHTMLPVWAAIEELDRWNEKSVINRSGKGSIEKPRLECYVPCSTTTLVCLAYCRKYSFPPHGLNYRCKTFYGMWSEDGQGNRLTHACRMYPFYAKRKIAKLTDGK